MPFEKVEPLVPVGAAPPFTVSSVEEDGRKFGFVQVLVGECEGVAVGGGPQRPTEEAALRIPLQNRADGDGEVRSPSWYQVWVVSDNRELVEYFRDQGNSSGHQAVLVRDLDFRLDETTGEFSLTAPGPTPSPFTVEDGALAPMTFPVALGNFVQEKPITSAELRTGAWTKVPGNQGYAEFRESVDGVAGGAQGRVVPEEGSQLDCLLGEGADAGSFDSVNDPVNDISAGFTVDNSFEVSLQGEGQDLRLPADPPCPG